MGCNIAVSINSNTFLQNQSQLKLQLSGLQLRETTGNFNVEWNTIHTLYRDYGWNIHIQNQAVKYSCSSKTSACNGAMCFYTAKGLVFAMVCMYCSNIFVRVVVHSEGHMKGPHPPKTTWLPRSSCGSKLPPRIFSLVVFFHFCSIFGVFQMLHPKPLVHKHSVTHWKRAQENQRTNSKLIIN